MEVGIISGHAYWKRGRSTYGFGVDGRLFAYKCNNCSYVEFYIENEKAGN